jgi:RHS repeat-associated protein
MTSFDYNSARQMIKRTDPLNRSTLFQWCKCGALKTLTDPMGRTTTWRHDVQGRIKSKQYVDGSQISYLYETFTSRLAQRIDEKLQITQYNYNRDDTIAFQSYANVTVPTPPVAFAYDASYRQLRSMTDGTGTTRYFHIRPSPVSFPVAGAGQLAHILQPLSSAIVFGYDELGRRIRTESFSAGGLSALSTVSFDAAGRTVSATNPLGVFNYNYDGNSFRPKSLTYPNGQTALFAYQDHLHDQLLQQITNMHGTTPISEFTYVREVAKQRITSWSQQSGTDIPLISTLTYDGADQLHSVLVSQGTTVINSFNYTYDFASNRLTEQIGLTATQLFYNALNELTSVDGGASAAATYQWDAEQRLVAVNSGNQSTQFTYDGLGRRVGIRKMVGGSEVSNRLCVWCDDHICEERAPSGVTSKRFFEQGVKLESGPAAGVFFYTRDHLGSIRELTDSFGNIRARYAYDPFGRRARIEGDLEADFGFAGMFWSFEVGLHLTWFRAYDATIARWLSRDPLDDAEVGVGANLFTYVRNNPVNFVDPFGLCCESERDAFIGAEVILGATLAAIAALLIATWATGGILAPLLTELFTVVAAETVAVALAGRNLQRCEEKPCSPCSK